MPRTGVDPPDTPLDSGAIIGWIGLLGEVRRDVSDAERIDQLRALERLKAAAAAARAAARAEVPRERSSSRPRSRAAKRPRRSARAPRPRPPSVTRSLVARLLVTVALSARGFRRCVETAAVDRFFVRGPRRLPTHA
jgi:hypothetical protein